MLEKLRRPHSPWRTEGGQLIPFWRSPRVIRVAVVAVIFLLITNVSYLHFNAEKRMQRTTGKTKAERDAVAAAGNSTLGFSNIKYINLPTRYDRSDAANLQAYLSGLDIEHVSGVLADDLHDVGLPPSHRPGELRTGELGCWRAHANVRSHTSTRFSHANTVRSGRICCVTTRPRPSLSSLTPRGTSTSAESCPT